MHRLIKAKVSKMTDNLAARFQLLRRSAPRAQPQLEDCYFYHKSDLPDGSTAEGPADYFDLRGNFINYIGNVDLRGKSVIDIGTASGFLGRVDKSPDAQTYRG